MRPPVPEGPPAQRIVEVADDPTEVPTTAAVESQPEGSAPVDIPMNAWERELERRRQGGQRRRQVKEEYVEVEGVPHSKITYSDGSVEFLSW